MKHQRGLSLNGMLIGSAVLAVLALLAMKAVPPWIEYANVLTAADLEITKEGGELVISFAYTAKVPLFKNASLVFDFEGSSAN